MKLERYETDEEISPHQHFELLWYFLPFFLSLIFDNLWRSLQFGQFIHFFTILFWEMTISEIVFDFFLTILIILDNLDNFLWQLWTIITLIDNFANVENFHNSRQFLNRNRMVGSFPYSSFALSLSYVCFHSNWCQKRWWYKFSHTI